MPKDNSIQHVLIIGSGPIIIGQACEFDYSGSQASRSLREEGIKVSLINSNPATIMTDPVTADQIYLWPLNVVNIRGKVKRLGRFVGKRSDWKKAFVTLKEGEKLELFESV